MRRPRSPDLNYRRRRVAPATNPSPRIMKPNPQTWKPNLQTSRPRRTKAQKSREAAPERRGGCPVPNLGAASCASLGGFFLRPPRNHASVTPILAKFVPGALLQVGGLGPETEIPRVFEQSSAKRCHGAPKVRRGGGVGAPDQHVASWHEPTETRMPSCTARDNSGRRHQPAGLRNISPCLEI